MAGVFDRLQKELDIRNQEGGISAIDLADLPPNLRKLMRMMLREVEMEYERLVQAAQSMKKSEFTDQAELDKSLATLVENGWLIQRGQGEVKYYRVNLRKKAGSNLSTGICAALNKKIENPKE